MQRTNQMQGTRQPDARDSSTTDLGPAAWRRDVVASRAAPLRLCPPTMGHSTWTRCSRLPLIAAFAVCHLARAAPPQPHRAGLRDSHGPRLAAEPMASAPDATSNALAHRSGISHAASTSDASSALAPSSPQRPPRLQGAVAVEPVVASHEAVATTGEGAGSFTPVPSPPSPPRAPHAQPPPRSGLLPAPHRNGARLASSPPEDVLVPSRGRGLQESAYYINLHVCVLRASGLTDKDVAGESDPYFEIVRPVRCRLRTCAPRTPRTRALTHILQRTHARTLAVTRWGCLFCL